MASSSSGGPYDRSYSTKPVNDLLVIMNHCGEKQKTHPAFLGPVSEYVALQPDLDALAARLVAARDDKNMADQLKDIMGLCVRALDNNADHVIKVAQHRNDPSLLNNTGYDFKQETPAVKERINLLDLIPGLAMKHMPGVSGGLFALLTLVKSKSVTELQLTETPDVEDSWKRYGEGTYNSARIEIRGQEPTKRLYFRVRYHAAGGVGHWSAPVSIIVL
jgi:hypothetical protein